MCDVRHIGKHATVTPRQAMDSNTSDAGMVVDDEMFTAGCRDILRQTADERMFTVAGNCVTLVNGVTMARHARRSITTLLMVTIAGRRVMGQ